MQNLPPGSVFCRHSCRKAPIISRAEKLQSNHPNLIEEREKKKSKMEKEHILTIANTIRTQLTMSVQPDVLLSWGISEPIATIFHEMPALAFQVEGRLFKGIVAIAYNAMDLYEVYLVSKDTENCVSDEVYADQLGDIIDVAIERGTDPEEYDAFCRAQLALLVTGNV